MTYYVIWHFSSNAIKCHFMSLAQFSLSWFFSSFYLSIFGSPNQKDGKFIILVRSSTNMWDEDSIVRLESSRSLKLTLLESSRVLIFPKTLLEIFRTLNSYNWKVIGSPTLWNPTHLKSILRVLGSYNSMCAGMFMIRANIRVCVHGSSHTHKFCGPLLLSCELKFKIL